MSNTALTTGLDIIVITLLAATIFYVLRLYKSLNEFKAQRKQFDNVIRNLLSAINQAERSIQTLKAVSTTEAAALEKLIMQSKALSEELNIINGAGEGIANRLEQLAEKNRRIVKPDMDQKRTPVTKERAGSGRAVAGHEKAASKKNKEDYAKTLKKIAIRKNDTPDLSEKDLPSFMISTNNADNDQDGGVSGGENLQSRAERELYEALRTNNRKTKGGAP